MTPTVQFTVFGVLIALYAILLFILVVCFLWRKTYFYFFEGHLIKVTCWYYGLGARALNFGWLDARVYIDGELADNGRFSGFGVPTVDLEYNREYIDLSVNVSFLVLRPTITCKIYGQAVNPE